jgi:hypothetical protein
MTLRVEDYVGRLRDTKVERELAKALRQEPEEERYRFIQQLFWHERFAYPTVAFELVRKCLHKRELLEAILQQGLEHGNASTIRWWLEAVIHGLGFRRVVTLLTERVKTDPVAVIKARYHLPLALARDKPRALQALQDLDTALAEAAKGSERLQQLLGPSRTQPISTP